jgi:2-deoxy-D-gluconate 3-dehydrogenase
MTGNVIDLTGRTALVTGARRGIGRAIATALAEAGADIVGVSHHLEPGSDVEQDVRALGRQFWGYSADLGDRKELYAVIDSIQADAPDIDILINNAGTILREDAVSYSDEDWDTVLAVNLTAPFILAREFGRGMVERRSGKVVFIASLLTFQGGIRVPAYSASKAGVGALIKALANEWAPHGVNVNGIAPGYVATDNTQALRDDPDRNASILGRIPAGRWAEASDIAGAAVFLASNAAGYVHGEIITVDGGWMGR